MIHFFSFLFFSLKNKYCYKIYVYVDIYYIEVFSLMSMVDDYAASI